MAAGAGAGAGAWVVGAVAAGAATPFVAEDASAGGVSGCVAGAEPCRWLGDAMFELLGMGRWGEARRLGLSVGWF